MYKINLYLGDNFRDHANIIPTTWFIWMSCMRHRRFHDGHYLYKVPCLLCHCGNYESIFGRPKVVKLSLRPLSNFSLGLEVIGYHHTLFYTEYQLRPAKSKLCYHFTTSERHYEYKYKRNDTCVVVNTPGVWITYLCIFILSTEHIICTFLRWKLYLILEFRK
jgi:hypothetical protein